MTLWECRDLACGYGHGLVLKGVTLTVERGECVAVIGPNGSGKTTLFRAATGLLPAAAGEVRLDGRPVSAYGRAELARKAAVLPQRFAPHFSFTVEEFAALGRYAREESPEAVRRALEETDLLALAARPVTELSGGEAQRALLAQALAQEPELLLLDEPTTFLDVGHQRDILDRVTALRRAGGLTVVMVLHDLNLASDYCDRIVLLNEGRVEREGAPAEVLDYALIERVYGAVVVVQPHPFTGRPHIFPVPRHELDGARPERAPS